MREKLGLDNFRVERRSIQGDATVIVLPRPPSLNNFQRSAPDGRRYSTQAYKNWQDAAHQSIMVQRPKRFTGPVTIEILVEETSRISDIDNRVKPILDALTKMQVIPDDNQKYLRGFSAYWSSEVIGAQVTITRAAA